MGDYSVLLMGTGNDKVNKSFSLGANNYYDGNYEAACSQLLAAWDNLDTPKLPKEGSFHILYFLVLNYVALKKYDEARKYMQLLYVSSTGRQDSSTREYYAGIIEYAAGNFDLAKELFYSVSKKTGGRAIKEDKQYRELIKGFGK